MGLFDLFKSKKPAASPKPADEAPRSPGGPAGSAPPPPPRPPGEGRGEGSPSPSRSSSPSPLNPLPHPGDLPITQLSLDADPANRPTWDALWRAVFALPAWHLITHAAPGVAPQPVTAKIQNQSCVLLYTSPARAAAARAHFAQAIPNSTVAVLSLPIQDAAALICTHPKTGPDLALFNQGTEGKGFTESLPAIATMLEFFTDSLPASCFARFTQAANKINHPEVWRRLKRHLARLPHWYILTDPQQRDLPQLLSADNQQRTTLYTTEHEATIAVAALNLGSPGNIPALLQVTPTEGAALLQKVRTLSNNSIRELILNYASEGVALDIDSIIQAVNTR